MPDRSAWQHSFARGAGNPQASGWEGIKKPAHGEPSCGGEIYEGSVEARGMADLENLSKDLAPEAAQDNGSQIVAQKGVEISFIMKRDLKRRKQKAGQPDICEAVRLVAEKCPRIRTSCYWAGTSAVATEVLGHRRSMDLDFHTLRALQDVRPILAERLLGWTAKSIKADLAAYRDVDTAEAMVARDLILGLIRKRRIAKNAES